MSEESPGVGVISDREVKEKGHLSQPGYVGESWILVFKISERNSCSGSGGIGGRKSLRGGWSELGGAENMAEI